MKMKTNEREGVSDKGPWKIAEFLLLVPGMYERHMVFSVRDGLSARIAQFEAMVESGKPVIVSFDIDAREYEGRWFNDLRAYGVRQKQ